MSAHGNPQNPPISPVFAKTPGRCRFSPPPPRAPKSGRSVAAAATSASKRLTPLGWLNGTRGGVFVALRRFQTASWGSYGLRRLSLSGFILFGFFDVAVNRAH